MDERFFSGTSNMVLPVKNKSFFPAAFQDKTRLAYYAALFNSLEVNASFYRLPRLSTVQKWESEVGNDFRFSFKLIQTVTHTIKNQFDPEPLIDFLAAITIEKRGCLLIQLPPKFGPEIIQLTMLLETLRDCNWPIAVEFRHPAWYTDQVFELLRKYQTVMVIHDMKASAAPMVVTTDTVYLRFHGPEGGYRGSYDEAYLNEYAGYIREWLDEGKTVYAYFNNTLGAAVQNLQTLNQLVDQV